MKMKILKKCKVFCDIDIFIFMDVLLEMVGMFIKKCGNEFFFIYSFMFEIIVYSFGWWYLEFIL